MTALGSYARRDRGCYPAEQPQVVEGEGELGVARFMVEVFVAAWLPRHGIDHDS